MKKLLTNPVNPVMLSDKTKKLLSDFRHENESVIIDYFNAVPNSKHRNFASWDKTIQFMIEFIKRCKKYGQK